VRGVGEGIYFVDYEDNYLIISNSRVDFNKVGYQYSTDGDYQQGGGGLYVNFGFLTMKNVLVESNFAANYGGGLNNSSTAMKVDCIFSNNDAGIGGGISHWSHNPLMLSNSTIASNRTQWGNGAGIDFTDTESNTIYKVYRSTIANILGTGISICGDGLFSLENITVSGNSAESSGVSGIEIRSIEGNLICLMLR